MDSAICKHKPTTEKDLNGSKYKTRQMCCSADQKNKGTCKYGTKRSPSVFADMCHQIRFSTKWIDTMRAFEGFFHYMSSSMCLQIIFSAKWMATVGTFVGFFSCMNSNMLHQTAKPRESFRTFSTAEGLLPCVNLHMILKAGCSCKGFRTFWAGGRVHFSMLK